MPTLPRFSLALAALLALLLVVLLGASDAAAQCAVCQPCAVDTDCGAGYVCRNMGAPAGMRCTQTCTAGTCPGDSVCYTFTFNGQSEMICLNPNANTAGNCPASYTCTDDGMSCTGLGTDCSGGAAACSQLEAFVCLTATDSNGTTRSYCTCECAGDADCDGAGTCGSNGGGQSFCQVGGNTGLCAGVTCPPGEVCDPGTGNCVSDPNDLCAGVVCPGGGLCSPATGTCVGGNPDADPGDMTMGDTSAGDTAAPPQDTMDGSSDTGPGADTSVGSDTSLGDVGSDTSVPPGGFVLSTVTPSTGFAYREQRVQITGQGFVAGMILRLDATVLTDVSVSTSSSLSATVPAALAVGTYDLHGQLPSGLQYTLPSAFQVHPVDSVDGGGSGDDEGCGCRGVRPGVTEGTGPLATGALVLMIGGLVLVRRRRKR